MNYIIIGVPYSEHSSYSELKEFVQCLRPDTIVSIVGGHMARSRAQSLCTDWMRTKDHTHNRTRRQIQTTLLDTTRLKQY